MKNYLNLIGLFALFFIFGSVAEAAWFETPLGAGANNPKAEVMKLQQFLFDGGYLKAAPTGNYLSLTTQAVKSFQQSQGIEATGFFGPLTRAAANRASDSKRAAAEVSSFTVSTPKVSGTASALLSQTKEIRWQTVNYPAGVGVNINLLRKVGSNPDKFELVRQIAKDAPNDGVEVWVKNQSDGKSDDLYIEVTCSTTHTFAGECRFAGEAVKAF